MQGLSQHHTAYFSSWQQGHETPALAHADESNRHVCGHDDICLLYVSYPRLLDVRLQCVDAAVIFRNCRHTKREYSRIVTNNRPFVDCDWVCLTFIHAGKDFTPPYDDPNLKLGGLLALNLHEFSSDVEEIADQV